MSKRGNIKIADIKEEIKKIKGTNFYYVSENGNFYKKDKYGKYLKLKTHVNKRNGYVYVGIRYADKSVNTTRRAHILVANAFIENKNHLPVVGHMDNNKTNNKVSNLYWTTVKENTQKAVDDGLLTNDKGIDDSQSIPIKCVDMMGNLVSVYGSISEAGRLIDGTTKSSIAKVVFTHGKGRKGYNYYPISIKFYKEHKNIAGKHLKTKPVIKRRISFDVFKDGKYLFSSNNQKQTAKTLNIRQSSISRMINENISRPLNGYTFYKCK